MRSPTSAAIGTQSHSDELKGNNDLLVITRPDVIESIHNAFLEAGADIIETNTFNGTTISQADYALDRKDEVDLINTTAARLAKKCTSAYMAANPGSVKFVAGAIGPTNKTLSVSPSVENPALRGITFDEVAAGVLRAGRWRCTRAASTCSWWRRSSTRERPRGAVRAGPFLRGEGRPHSRVRFRHDRGQQRPHAERPDERGVLEQREPRQAVCGGSELRARREGHEAVHREPEPLRRLLRVLLPERRSPERDGRVRPGRPGDGGGRASVLRRKVL